MITWGGGECGQLGSGYMWDDPRPRLLQDLHGVLQIGAGLRHSMAVRATDDPRFTEVWAWGYNGYGELGLGDADPRLQPTRVSALDRARVTHVSCGDRHTLFLTNYTPLLTKEDPILSGYFDAIEVSYFVILWGMSALH